MVWRERRHPARRFEAGFSITPCWKPALPSLNFTPLKILLDVRRQLSYCSMTVKDGHDFSD
jgi:hypothetical protein